MALHTDAKEKQVRRSNGSSLPSPRARQEEAAHVPGASTRKPFDYETEMKAGCVPRFCMPC